jgi:hypothetical protein
MDRGEGRADERIASIRKAIHENSVPRGDRPPWIKGITNSVLVQGNKNMLMFIPNEGVRSMPNARKTRAGAFTGVDWSKAPRHAHWWAVDADGTAHWFCTPNVAAFTDFWFSEPLLAPDFGYQGDYRDSLVERPE